MRAVVCVSLTGEDGLEVRSDHPEPGELRPDQVRIAVEAASVNFPDTLITRGEYQVRSEPPFVLGNECAGTLTQIGADISGYAIGDRVLALTGTGAFAEIVDVVPGVHQVHRIPAQMTFEQAAAFNLTFGTAGHGLIQRGHVQPDETVLVTGAAGGCGSAAVMVARALGARVVATAGGPEKANLAAELGADDVIDHHTLDGERALSERVKALTAGRGVDVVFDNVGAQRGSDDVRDLLRCLAWHGRYLVVGFAGGGIPKVALNQTILRSISLVGVAYGASAIVAPATNRALFTQLFDLFERGRIAPYIGRTFAFEQAPDAVRTVRDRTALGKTVITF
jgi:NADPH2:quinone reductase